MEEGNQPSNRDHTRKSTETKKQRQRMKEIEKIKGQWGKLIEKGKGGIEAKEWKG